MEKLKSKLIKKGVLFNKPIIGLMAGEHMGKELRDRYKNQCQIVGLYSPNKYADVFLYDLTPFEWAVVFSFFSVTVTHFFHGTLLSLKNLTPVVCAENSRAHNRSYDTKIKDLINRLDLGDFYFKLDDGYEEIFSAIDRLMINPEKNRIHDALIREAESYNDFSIALGTAINIK
jgi:hypothetical protein